MKRKWRRSIIGYSSNREGGITNERQERTRHQATKTKGTNQPKSGRASARIQQLASKEAEAGSDTGRVMGWGDKSSAGESTGEGIKGIRIELSAVKEENSGRSDSSGKQESGK
jgi:hypothetical protein